MDMSNQEFAELVKQYSKPSPIAKNMTMAFLVGGGICALGQGLQLFYQSLGASQDDAGAWTAISLILLSALLTAFQLYDRLARVAGAGTLVPVTGFANSIVSPAMEFKADARVIIGTSQKTTKSRWGC